MLSKLEKLQRDQRRSCDITEAKFDRELKELRRGIARLQRRVDATRRIVAGAWLSQFVQTFNRTPLELRYDGRLRVVAEKTLAALDRCSRRDLQLLRPTKRVLHELQNVLEGGAL